MDWQFAIDKHRAGLKRVLAALVGMAACASPGAGPAASGSSRPLDAFLHATGMKDFGLGPIPASLPRHLHRAILRLLRPAEAAARRLVIVAARELLVAPPPALRATSPAPQGVSSRFAKGKSIVPVARWKAGERRDGAKHRGPGRVGAAGDGGGTRARPASIALPLTDPLRRDRGKVLRASRIAMPRICVPGWSEPAPLPPKPEPHDEIDATRLTLRLAALARALDDLPRAARRFARWHARNMAARARGSEEADAAGNAAGASPRMRRRLWPLRFGRPPGQTRGRCRHAVHQILEDLHGLADWVLEAPDTS